MPFQRYVCSAAPNHTYRREHVGFGWDPCSHSSQQCRLVRTFGDARVCAPPPPGCAHLLLRLLGKCTVFDGHAWSQFLVAS